jgi:hypothetical protein
MTLTWKCEDAEHGFQKRWKQRAVRAREETITFTGPCEQEAKQLYTRSNYTQIRGSLSKRKWLLVHLPTQGDEGAKTFDFQIYKQISPFNVGWLKNKLWDLQGRPSWGGGWSRRRRNSNHWLTKVCNVSLSKTLTTYGTKFNKSIEKMDNNH